MSEGPRGLEMRMLVEAFGTDARLAAVYLLIDPQTRDERLLQTDDDDRLGTCISTTRAHNMNE